MNGDRISPIKRYAPEVRERAVRMVLEHEQDYSSRWSAIESITVKFGCTKETLRRWVLQREQDSGRRPGATTAEKDRIKVLEREVKELRQTNKILRKASAWAILDRQSPRRSSAADRSNGDVHRYQSKGVRSRANLQGIADCSVILLC